MSAATFTAEMVATQLGDSYAALPAEERSRHVRMLRTAAAAERPVLWAGPTAAAPWRVTVASPDAIGVLAIIAGLFTVHRMDIIRARVFSVEVPRTSVTVRPARGTRRAPSQRSLPPISCALDVFDVGPLTGPPSPTVWTRFRRDLDHLMGLVNDGRTAEAQDWVIDRFSAALRELPAAGGSLAPVAIAIENEPASLHTRLAIRSRDVPGFLFAFTNALSGSTVDIRAAAVDTVDGEAADVFWVTDRDGVRVTGQEALQELRVACALIKQFTHLLPRSPHPAQALRQFRGLVSQVLASPQGARDLTNLETPEVLQSLADLMGVSRFLWEDFLRLQHENLYPVVADASSLDAAADRSVLEPALTARLAAAPLEEREAVVNAFKDRWMFRIDLRHITGRIDFGRFSEELTVLAEVVVNAAAALGHARMAAAGLAAPAPWAIVALGKFGGREMGFGSDIELVFVYGNTVDPGASAHAYYEDFVKAFQGIIHARQDGIFEIDLRLRPHGSAGALAVPIGGFRRYYAEAGEAQQFERLALVKLRPVAGDPELGAAITAVRDSFVYSTAPLDFGDIQKLRGLQVEELVPVGAVNAKYSPGGLVDLEYFVQTRQILQGAADPSVRTTNTLEAVARLEASGALTPAAASALRDDYGFLRRLIDALRVVRGNAKDLNIPAAGTDEFRYLAQRLHFASPETLSSAIAAHMAAAARVWQDPIPRVSATATPRRPHPTG